MLDVRLAVVRRANLERGVRCHERYLECLVAGVAHPLVGQERDIGDERPDHLTRRLEPEAPLGTDLAAAFSPLPESRTEDALQQCVWTLGTHLLDGVSQDPFQFRLEFG